MQLRNTSPIPCLKLFFINFSFVTVNLTFDVKLPHSVFFFYKCLKVSNTKISPLSFCSSSLGSPTQILEAEIIITEEMESSERSLGRK